MELKKAYELESSLKVTLVVRDEQTTGTDEEEHQKEADYHIEHKKELKSVEIYEPPIAS
jgi:hypothetical protein